MILYRRSFFGRVVAVGGGVEFLTDGDTRLGKKVDPPEIFFYF